MKFSLFLVFLLFSVRVFSVSCDLSLSEPYLPMIEYAKSRPLSPGYLMAAHAYTRQGSYNPASLFGIIQEYVQKQGVFGQMITEEAIKIQPKSSRPQARSYESLNNILELIENIVNTSTVLSLRSPSEIQGLISKRIYLSFSKSAESIENLSYSLLFLAERYPEVEQALYGINFIINYYFDKKLGDWYPVEQTYSSLSIRHGQEASNDASYLYRSLGMSNRAKSIGAMNAIDFAITAAIFDIYFIGSVRYARDLKSINDGLESPFDQETQYLLRQFKLQSTEISRALDNLHYIYALEVFGFIARAKVISYEQYLRFIKFIITAGIEEEFVMSLSDVPGIESFIESNDPMAEFLANKNPAYQVELRKVVFNYLNKAKDFSPELSIDDLQWLAGLAAPRF